MTVTVFFVIRFSLLMTGTKPYSNVKFRDFVTFSFFLYSRAFRLKYPVAEKSLLDFKEMEYISFRKLLKALK